MFIAMIITMMGITKGDMLYMIFAIMLFNLWMMLTMHCLIKMITKEKRSENDDEQIL